MPELPLAEVAFEVTAPGSLGRFTREHPDARALVRFVSLAPEGARLLVTLAGPTEWTSPVVRELRAELGQDGEFEILSITPYSVVLKASAPLDRTPWVAPVSRFIEVFGRDTLLEPALVERGRLRIRGVAAQQMDTRRALEKLQELQRLGPWEGFRVLHVSEFDPKAFGDRSAPLLDPEQEELLRLALVMGYYDTPRRCNLEDIAGRVGLSVSPVHKKLKEVEHTLIRAHLEPDAPRAPRRRRQARGVRPAPPPGLMREVVVRIARSGFGPAAFTARHDATRVVYQPLGDARDAASHLYIVLGPPEHAREFLHLVEGDPALVDFEVLSRDAEHVSLKVRRRVPPASLPVSAAEDAPGAVPAPPPAGPAPGEPPGLGADPLQSLVGALGRDAYAKAAVCEKGSVLGRVVVMRRLGEEELAATLQELAQAAGWQEAELVGVKDLAAESALMTRPRAEKPTDRQEEVLRIAHALGYYRTPRGCTLEDVAATLGISANAVHKNLTAAEQRIIQGYLGAALQL